MTAEAWLIRMANGPVPRWRGAVLALALPLASTIVRLILEPVLMGQAAYFLYFPAIFLATLLAGYRAGLLATILCGGLGYGLFQAPGASLALDRSLLTLVMFWGVASLLIVAVAGLRAALRRLGEREQQLRSAAEREELLAHEMSHRVKNLLAIVQSLIRRTARNAVDLGDFLRRLTPRLDALAAAQQLACAPATEMRLPAVVALALAPVSGKRISLGEVPDCVLEPETAQGLFLTLHELSTNAAKYGALSNDAGRVEIVSRDDGPGAVVLDWSEIGGPPVSPPTTIGFGSVLIRRALQGPGEGVDLDYMPDGLRCRLRCRVVDAMGAPVRGTSA